MLMTSFIFQVCNEWNEKENIFFYVKYGLKFFRKTTIIITYSLYNEYLYYKLYLN